MNVWGFLFEKLVECGDFGFYWERCFGVMGGGGLGVLI